MEKNKNIQTNTGQWEYRVISEVLELCDHGEYRTYAIKLTGPGYEEVLHDVSVYEGIAFDLAELFNKYQLFPCQFKDAVCDLLP